MFDTFHDESTQLFCKHCGKQQSVQTGIQTKFFDKILADYYIGDVVTELDDKTTRVNEWMWCENCTEQIELILAFKQQIFIGIFQQETEIKHALRNFNIVENYKKMFDKKEFAERRVFQLESRLKDIIDIHGNPPTQNIFNHYLYTINGHMIDYDIIKTLKNILKND